MKTIEDLKKHTNIDAPENESFLKDINGMFNWIRSQIYNQVKDLIKYYNNENIIKMVINKYRMDFMVGGYQLKYDSNIDNNFFTTNYSSDVLDKVLWLPSENVYNIIEQNENITDINTNKNFPNSMDW